MLLAVDIDNVSISFGVFREPDENTLITQFKISADATRTSDEYAIVLSQIFQFHNVDPAAQEGVIVSSVVPTLTPTVIAAITRLCTATVMTVGKGIKTGFPIKIDHPSELGADLVANAAAVVSMRPASSTRPCIIIDMGTATTVFAINQHGEYIGGSILPGVGISLDALHGRTALLPTVNPDAPTRAIGKNSQESVRSGVILGNAMMLDGFIARFAAEMKSKEPPQVVITGEYAEIVLPSCTQEMEYVPDLTLKGLCCIYKNNV